MRLPERQRATFRLLALLLGLLLAVVAPPAGAAEMTGRVVGIIDGDTIDVLMPGFQVARVRLAGIDAPERGQAFATAAKAALSELVFARQVVVHWKKRDRYERLVGKVTVSGADANLAMVTRGMAWHYVRFEAEQEQGDRAAYAQAEREARTQRRGLWSGTQPVAPWEFRRERATARTHGTPSDSSAGVLGRNARKTVARPPTLMITAASELADPRLHGVVEPAADVAATADWVSSPKVRTAGGGLAKLV